MGRYHNMGKELLYGEMNARSEHIADCKDNEAAHFLAYHANVSGFIPNALRTLSPAWHGDKVSLAHLKGMVNGAIDAINKLDKLKKTLFYGRDNNLDPAEGQADSMGLLDSMVMPVGANPANVFHAILGKVTEAGELLEAIRACWRGNEVFDRVNAIEEVGDGFWYDAVLLDEMQSDFPEAMGTVVAKLRVRFPDKFTEVNANERDLAAERVILEGGSISAPLPDGVTVMAHESVLTGDVATTEPGINEAEWLPPGVILDENGGDYSPGDELGIASGIAESGHLATPLGIVEAATATGKLAVERAAASAAGVFGKLENVGKPEPEMPTSDLGGELAKSPAERINPLPQEGMAQTNAGVRDNKK